MLPEIGPQSRCDLHLHTNRSDGRLTPDQMVEEAITGGLDIISLTDHDLTANISPGVHRRGDQSVFIIQGAEVTGVHEEREYHLLVYFPRETQAPMYYIGCCA